MKPVYGIGDVHGIWDNIIGPILQYQIRDSILIQVGDFGIGMRNSDRDLEMLDELNSTLKSYNNYLYAIRGNHDNPSWFDQDPTVEDGDSHFKIMFLKDYSVFEIQGRKFLFVGGATSIDRSVLTVGRNYFTNEGFVLEEDKLKDLTGIDVVITHSAPGFANPIGFNNLVYHWADLDKKYYKSKNQKKNLLGELELERNQLTRMWEILKEKNQIKKWVYGHFHHSKKQDHFGTEFILLNVNEFLEI